MVDDKKKQDDSTKETPRKGLKSKRIISQDKPLMPAPRVALPAPPIPKEAYARDVDAVKQELADLELRHSRWLAGVEATIEEFRLVRSLVSALCLIVMLQAVMLSVALTLLINRFAVFEKLLHR